MKKDRRECRSFCFWRCPEKIFKKNCGFVQQTGTSVCLCICKYPKLSSFWIAEQSAALLNVLISWFCIRLTNCLAVEESRFIPGLFYGRIFLGVSFFWPGRRGGGKLDTRYLKLDPWTADYRLMTSITSPPTPLRAERWHSWLSFGHGGHRGCHKGHGGIVFV